MSSPEPYADTRRRAYRPWSWLSNLFLLAGGLALLTGFFVTAERVWLLAAASVAFAACAVLRLTGAWRHMAALRRVNRA